MVIFHSYVSLPEGIHQILIAIPFLLIQLQPPRPPKLQQHLHEHFLRQSQQAATHSVVQVFRALPCDRFPSVDQNHP